MRFTEEELQAILDDDNKRIVDDVIWTGSRGHLDSYVFEVPLLSDISSELRICGSCNPIAKKLNFTLVKGSAMRIYSLDIGHPHTVPETKERKRIAVGWLHKHRWDNELKDKNAYCPTDITAKSHEVEKAWKEFCAEAKIIHEGRFYHYLQKQKELFR